MTEETAHLEEFIFPLVLDKIWLLPSFLPSLLFPAILPPSACLPHFLSGSQSKRRWRPGCHHGVALSSRGSWASCNIILPGCDQGQGNRDGWGSAGGGGGAETMQRIVALHSLQPPHTMRTLFASAQTSCVTWLWSQTIIKNFPTVVGVPAYLEQPPIVAAFMHNDSPVWQICFWVEMDRTNIWSPFSLCPLVYRFSDVSTFLCIFSTLAGVKRDTSTRDKSRTSARTSGLITRKRVSSWTLCGFLYV